MNLADLSRRRDRAVTFLSGEIEPGEWKGHTRWFATELRRNEERVDVVKHVAWVYARPSS